MSPDIDEDDRPAVDDDDDYGGGEDDDNDGAEAQLQELLYGAAPVDMAAALVLTEIGRHALAAGDAKTAIAALEKKHAFVVAQFGAQSVVAATSGIDLGEALKAAGDFGAARQVLERSVASYRELGVADGRWARAMAALADAAYMLADYSVAERLYLETIDALPTDDEGALRQAFAMDYLAQIYLRKCRHEEAEALLHRALGVFERADRGADLAVCLNLLASVCFQTHRYRESEALLRRALELNVATFGPRSLNVAKTMDHLASTLAIRAQQEDDRSLCDEVVSLGEEALSIFREVLPPEHVSIVRCEHNLSLYRDVRESLGKWMAGGSRGSPLEEVTRLERAFGTDHPQVHVARLAYAWSLAQEHSYDEALASAERATERLGALLGVSSSHHLDGQGTVIAVLRRYCSYLLGEPTGLLSPSESMRAQILAHTTRGSVIDEETPPPEEKLPAAVTGLLERGLRLGDDFLAAARSAIQQRGAAMSLLGRGHNISLHNCASDYLEIVAMARSGGCIIPSEAALLAFETMQLVAIEGSLASAFDMGMQAGQTTAARATGLRREQRDLALRVLAAQDEAVDAALGGGVRTGARFEQLQAMRERLAAIDAELDLELPSLASRIRLEDVGGSLSDDEAVVSYFLGTRALFVLAITPRATTFKRVQFEPGLIEAMCEQFLQSMALDRSTTVDELPAVDFFNGSELYKILFEPLEPVLSSASTLFLIPAGALWGIPFAALIRDEAVLLRAARLWDRARMGPEVPPDFREILPGVSPVFQAVARLGAADACVAAARGGAWLADRFATALLPSASALVALRRATRVPPKLPFLGIGSPDHADDASIAEDAERLLRTLAEAMRADADRSVFVGPDATKSRVLELDQTGALAEARVLCFATHTDFGAADDLLADPGLVFSTGESTNSDTRVLRASEIAQLHLNADWVLLTACTTGGSAGRTAHVPMSGMARSFFMAGAQTLLVSHWLVDVATTCELVGDLFAPELGSTTKAVALQSVMSNLRSSRRHGHLAHPAFWACFSIVGDGGSPTAPGGWRAQ